jgi:hypothetical protein
MNKFLIRDMLLSLKELVDEIEGINNTLVKESILHKILHIEEELDK